MTDLQNPTSTFTLNNGVEMPVIGLGVYQSEPEDTAKRARTRMLKVLTCEMRIADLT